MQRSHLGLIYSSQDLIQYINSPFASWMDRNLIESPECIAPDPESDEMVDALIQLGHEHEQQFLDTLLQQGTDVFLIESRGAFDITLSAMQAGHPYIYQAALQHKNFVGYPDFLVRVEQASNLGSWSYIPLECKLAMNPKPDFVLQATCYLDLLHSTQGRLPEEFRLLLGDCTQQSFVTEQYIYYFYQVRQTFLGSMDNFDPTHQPTPGLGNHGRWQAIAESYLQTSDHLSQVANITQSQIKKLEAAGITTAQKLAEADKRQHIPKLDPVIFERLVDQAYLQKASTESDHISYRLIAPHPDQTRRGFALLPPASSLDVFFDMEGYPLIKGGLEYLFGAVFIDRDSIQFKDWWAHDSVMEKQAFESFVDWIYQRWLNDPAMHVYHYAPYETTALKRLMQRYATRETQIDALLRAEVFVDLYQIVRQSLRIGTISYSIKYLEPLYGRQRQEDVKNAVDSVVQYFQWLQVQDGYSPQTSSILKSIRDYNQVDCESTLELTLWLRKQQQIVGIPYQSKDEPQPQTEACKDTKDSTAQLAETLISELPDSISAPDQQIQQLLAHLLQFHEREMKPFWWQRFTWLQMEEADLFDEPDCIAGLVRTKTPPIAPQGSSKSWSYEYRFNPTQDLRIGTGSTWFVPEESQKGCRLKELDPVEGRAVLSISEKQLQQTRAAYPDWEPPQRTSLIDINSVNTDKLTASIYETVQQWYQLRTLQPALHDLLYRQSPRLLNHSTAEIIPPGTELMEGTVSAIENLDSSLLCIQGPPGSGKTYTAAHVIAHLVNQGKRIAICATSHQAITNLMLKVAAMCEEQQVQLRGLKYGGLNDERLKQVNLFWKNSFKQVKLSEFDIFGATAFQLCKPNLAGQWDYLFVDEAGQMSLANLIAIARCAANIVLLGDQMQLEQPIQAAHPGESGQSALGYYLDGKATIPPEMGIFLDTSYRMHPEICQFISATIYENRLRSHQQTQHHHVECNGSLLSKNNGIIYVPVKHEGNIQNSIEEVDRIDHLIEILTGLPYITHRGAEKGCITPSDILVIAPYNLQVNLLKEKLRDRARIGTVDKFQGQEAPILILSMCASSGSTIARGLDFLLNKNRLNVAVSRAQCLSIVVGSPEIASTYCKTVPEIELINFYCKAIHSVNLDALHAQ